MGASDDAITAGMRAQLLVSGGNASVTRGSQTVPLLALPSQVTEHELRFRERDFLFETAAFTLGEPKVGDLWTYGGVQLEVRPFESERAWRESAPGWTRVHLKYLEWQRDRLRCTRRQTKAGSGQAKTELEKEFWAKGLVKPTGGDEQFGGNQRTAFLTYIVILPVASDTLRLDAMDKLTVDVNGTCRDLEITSIRDPGTGGSVLYAECQVRVLP